MTTSGLPSSATRHTAFHMTWWCLVMEVQSGEQRGAGALLEAVMRRLRTEQEQAGRLAEYEAPKAGLTAQGLDYAALGRALGIEPASARSAVHRLRKRFRELFRAEVSDTVADPAEVEAEMQAVIAALGAL